MTNYRNTAFEQSVAIARALGDEHRARAVMALADGELCACQIIELLGLAPSTVSKHLSILAQAGLVNCVKIGRWRYYHQADETNPVARRAVEWLASSQSDSPQILADRRRLAEIVACDPEELCKKQNCKC